MFKRLWYPKLRRETENFERKITPGMLVALMVIYLALVVAVKYIFNVNWWGTIGTMVLGVVLIPSALYYWCKEKNETQRFEEAVNYMEQLICSFKRNDGQITAALEDCLSIFKPDEKIYPLIEQALYMKKTGVGTTGANITEQALKVIYDEFPSRRMKSLHEFLIMAEEEGGVKDKELDIYLNEIQMWKMRCSMFKKERKHHANFAFISIILGMILCYVTKIMTPSDLGIDFTNMPLYQVTTTLVVILFVLLVFFIFKLQAKPQLDEEGEHAKEDQKIMTSYEYVKHFDPLRAKKERTQMLIVGGVIALTISITGYILGYFVLFLTIAVVIFAFFAIPALNKKGLCIRVVKRYITREFPYLLLKTTVLIRGASVYQSLKTAVGKIDGVMALETQELVNHLRENPGQLTPFVQYFEEFPISEVKTAMKVLYSVQSLGLAENEGQLDVLVEENNILMDKSEKLSNESKIAGLSMLKSLPLVFASIKLLADLVGLLFAVMQMMGNMAV